MPAILLVARLPTDLRANVGAAAVAREAARAIVLADDWEAGMAAAAAIEEREEQRLRGAGRRCPGSVGCLQLHVEGRLVRGETIVVEVGLWSPGVSLPLIGDVGESLATFRHLEVVDPFRSNP